MLRQLVEGDCGNANPLIQLGGQLSRDAAHKDEGLNYRQFDRVVHSNDMANEFLGQITSPPQSFHMGALLEEMREIEHINVNQMHPTSSNRVIGDTSNAWVKEFQPLPPPLTIGQNNDRNENQEQLPSNAYKFFDQSYRSPLPPLTQLSAPYPTNFPQYIPEKTTEKFFEDTSSDVIIDTDQPNLKGETTDDWINDFQRLKEENDQLTSNYNENFWQRLQEEWQKLSEEAEHPWLSEFNENYDPYKEYVFAEENPMAELENAFEKGKEYLNKGDVPSAVLCFEVAAKKEPENAEVWELLGLTQAENEMDPQSIAALKHSLNLKPENPQVLMALAICYTNESLQNHALKMLINWLQINPKYKHLVENNPGQKESSETSLASSLISRYRLREVQNMYLDAVRQSPQEVDANVQQALGVLYNLSGEFDKAVDCFHAALQVEPKNAKIWNRLGASLSNGSRSVEAVEAYQEALKLEPGFIRVRYNVGVCCMNLKAYQQSIEHLLTALNMQANSAALKELPSSVVSAGSLQMSESIWSTLKMVASLMGRSDLHNFINERNLQALNESFTN